MGLGGGPWFEPNHRIEISDCYVESHWESNGFIDGGGQCGTGNCSMFNYWMLRGNRGGYGAYIGVAGENSVIEGNTAYSCCTDPAAGCQVGGKAGAFNEPNSRDSRANFLKSVVVRGNTDINQCPTIPTGPT